MNKLEDLLRDLQEEPYGAPFDKIVESIIKAARCDHSHDKKVTLVDTLSNDRAVWMCECGALIDSIHYHKGQAPQTIDAADLDHRILSITAGIQVRPPCDHGDSKTKTYLGDAVSGEVYMCECGAVIDLRSSVNEKATQMQAMNANELRLVMHHMCQEIKSVATRVVANIEIWPKGR